RPALDLLLLALAVGDDALAELLLDLVGLFLVAVEDLVLVGRGPHVVDRHGEPRTGGPVEAELLHRVERAGGDRLGEVDREAVDDGGRVLLPYRSVYVV